MDIESKVGEIVEKALIDKGWDIVDCSTLNSIRFKNEAGITAIVRALLTSEEIAVVSKSHIADLEKRVEKQAELIDRGCSKLGEQIAQNMELQSRIEKMGKVVDAAKKFHEGLVCDGPEYCRLSEALKDLEGE